MFYSYIYYQGPSFVVHCSTSEITEYAIDPTGYEVYSVVYMGDYVPSETLITQITVNSNTVSSSGPTIQSQEKLT